MKSKKKVKLELNFPAFVVGAIEYKRRRSSRCTLMCVLSNRQRRKEKSIKKNFEKKWN